MVTFFLSNWSWGSSGLVLKKLPVDFDPEREPMAVKRFWSKNALETLGNKLGSFVGLEANWETKHDCRWAWINIELDVWYGLIGSLQRSKLNSTPFVPNLARLFFPKSY